MGTTKNIIPLLLALLIAVGSHAQTPLSPLPLGLFSETIDPTIKAQLVNDLTFAKSIIFKKTSPLHQKIFGGTGASTAGTKNPYTKWLFQRIKRISVGNCANNDAAVACVIPILEQNKMRITEQYLKMSAPQVARMSVLFHEARHTELNPTLHEGDKDRRYWLHDTCPTPFLDENNNPRMSIWTGLPLAGVDGCDSTAEGSYGVAIVMLKNIALNSTNTTEKIRTDAQIYADDQLTRIIDADAHEQLVNDK